MTCFLNHFYNLKVLTIHKIKMDLAKQSYSTCISCIRRQERFYGFLKFLFKINFLDLQRQCQTKNIKEGKFFFARFYKRKNAILFLRINTNTSNSSIQRYVHAYSFKLISIEHICVWLLADQTVGFAKLCFHHFLWSVCNRKDRARFLHKHGSSPIYPLLSSHSQGNLQPFSEKVLFGLASGGHEYLRHWNGKWESVRSNMNDPAGQGSQVSAVLSTSHSFT